MIPYAATVLAAREAAIERGARATIGKVAAEPGAANAVCSSVRAWLDVRAPQGKTLEDTVDQILAAAGQEAEANRVTMTASQESFSPEVEFDAPLAGRLAGALAARGIDAPTLPTGAGHDAGVLADRLPTAMLFVRNPSGVSHARAAEHADVADCAAGVSALAAVLRGTGRPDACPRGGPGQGRPVHRRAGTGTRSWPGCAAVSVRPGVLIEARWRACSGLGDPGGAARGGDAPAAAVRLRWPHAARAGQRPLARVPPRAARRLPRLGPGTFWTWRERMYEVGGAAGSPASYLALARAVYAEMALAGVTCVGEFHYLHHGPGGSPYPDPNAMGRALIQAAAEAGLRITLLDTCYLTGGLAPDGTPMPLSPVQQRFSDGDADLVGGPAGRTRA